MIRLQESLTILDTQTKDNPIEKNHRLKKYIGKERQYTDKKKPKAGGALWALLNIRKISLRRNFEEGRDVGRGCVFGDPPYVF